MHFKFWQSEQTRQASRQAKLQNFAVLSRIGLMLDRYVDQRFPKGSLEFLKEFHSKRNFAAVKLAGQMHALNLKTIPASELLKRGHVVQFTPEGKQVTSNRENQLAIQFCENVKGSDSTSKDIQEFKQFALIYDYLTAVKNDLGRFQSIKYQVNRDPEERAVLQDDIMKHTLPSNCADLFGLLEEAHSSALSSGLREASILGQILNMLKDFISNLSLPNFNLSNNNQENSSALNPNIV